MRSVFNLEVRVKMAPKVSVIIPVYNASDYVGECLDSILLQTLADIEVICVDDGSTDDSLSILQTYAMLDERLKVIHQENMGPGAARNRGLKEAQGEYLSFLDADDFCKEHMLEQMVAQAEKDHSDVVVAGWHTFDNNTNQPLKENKVAAKFQGKSPLKPMDFARDLFELAQPALWNKLYRAELIRKYDLQFNVQTCYFEDGVFIFPALCLANKISLIDEAFVYYRINNKHSLVANKEKYFKDLLIGIADSYAVLKALKLDDFFASYRGTVVSMMRSVLFNIPPQKKKENLLQIKKVFSSELCSRIVSQIDTEVSIVVPVYNAADTLGDCLDSCLNQTLTAIEVICVDEGSTDASREILDKYAQKDNRIVVLHQEDKGLANACNKAMDIMAGRFILFLDADSCLIPEACEVLHLCAYLFGLDMCQYATAEFPKDRAENNEEQENSLSWLPEKFPDVFNKELLLAIYPYMTSNAQCTFYQRNFLLRENIRWTDKKTSYAEIPFFTEGLVRSNLVGILDFPCCYTRNYKAKTKVKIEAQFNEWVDVLKDTLSIVKKFGSKELLCRYCAFFLQEIVSKMAKFSSPDKSAPVVYDFISMLRKKYHCVLPEENYKWCLAYLKGKRKEKAKFALAGLKQKCIKNQYSLSLVSWQRAPLFSIKILGIPFLYAKYEAKPLTKEDEKTRITRRKIFIKLCGITLLKIREVTHG